MLQGIIAVGGIAIAGQLAVIVGFVWYIRSRHTIEAPETRRRLRRWLVAGTALAIAGQILALGSLGYLWVIPGFSFETMTTLVDVGVVALLVGYLVVIGTFVQYTRAAT